MVPAALILDKQSMEDAGVFFWVRHMAHPAKNSGGDGRGCHTWRGPGEIRGHRQGLCGSFRQRDGQDGYSVPNFFN